MDQVWSVLNKACDENEKELNELEAFSDTLPRQPRNWFYLNEDYLGLSQCVSESNMVPPINKINDETFIKVKKPRKLSSENEYFGKLASQEVTSGHVTKETELQDGNMNEVLADSEFPKSVRSFLTEMKAEETKSLPESDTVTFCQYFINFEKYISEGTGVKLFNRILYPVICNSEKMFLSLLLLEKIRELTNKYPIFIMNGVIVPALSRENLGKEQLDIVSDILSGMNESCLNAVLKVFLDAIKRNDENSLKLVTTVMNRKPKLDNEVAFVLVTKLHNLSAKFSSNMQFGRMLLEVIPLLNAKLTEASLKTLKEVVDHHNTFLKATIWKLFADLTPLK